MPISFSCDGCGKGYQVDDALAGKRVKCKSCAFVITVPSPTRSASGAASRPALKSFGAPETPRSTARGRPSAPAPAPSNIYGLDEDEMEEAAAPAPDDGLAPPMRRPGKGKPKAARNSSSNSDPMPGTTGPMLWVNIGFLGLIVILGLVSLAVPAAYGVFLIVSVLALVVLWLVGLVWSFAIAFRESVACGFLMFVPIYPLYYLITRWSEMKRPFFVNLAGGGLCLYFVLITAVVVTKGVMQANVVGQPQMAQPAAFMTAEEIQADPAVAQAAPAIAGAPAARPAGPAVAGPWRAQADPSAEQLIWPAGNALAAQIPKHFSSNRRIIYPAVPSHFVIIGGNDSDDQFREVWDLRGAGTVIGRISGNLSLSEPLMLSPDGAYFAGREITVPRKLIIFEVATGQPIGAIPDGDNIPDFGEFIGPDQLLLGTSYKNGFTIWDFKAGKVVREVKVGARIVVESVSLSPGRRYLALSTASPERVKIIDLSNGQTVGDDILPKDGSNDYHCEGTAFSPDGTMLTGLFGCGFDAAHLVTWDVASGKRLSDFRYPGYQPFKPEHGYACRAVKWMPDGGAWLLRDKVIVERESGTIVWTMPFEPAKGSPEGPRLLLDSSRMIALTGKRGEEILRVLPLPREKIEVAAGLARSGGDVSDAILPKVHEADVASVKKIPPPVTAITWLVRPDPQPTPRKPFSLKAAPLTAKMDEIKTILFSSPGAATAFVSSGQGAARAGEDTARQGEKPGIVERINLTTARGLNHLEIPAICELAAVSPDASLVAVLKVGNHDRIDVYNAADGSHVVGFRPYESAADAGKSVVSCEFVDAGHLLTSSGDGTVTLWALPECRAVYTMESVATGPLVFSPARKWAAMISGPALRLIEPATGTIKGEIPLPSGITGAPGLVGAAFRPDGQELSAILDGQIVRFDLAKGQVLENSPVPYTSAATLEYAAKGYLLIDKQALFDLSKQKIVWIYDGGPHATGSPNGAHWFATGRPYDKASLTFKLYPDPAVAQAIAAAFDLKTKSMLGAGSTVSIQIEGEPPRDPDTFRTGIVDAFGQQLQSIGATVADGAPTRLLVRFRDNSTGKTLHFRRHSFGPGGAKQEDIDIPERQIDYDLSIQDQKGTTIPLHSDRYRSSPGLFVSIPSGETDLDLYLRMTLWNQARSRLLSIGLPFFVAKKPGGAIVILPGLTRLNPTLR